MKVVMDMGQSMPIIAERAALGVSACDDSYSEIWLMPARKKYLIPYAALDGVDIVVCDDYGTQINVNGAIMDAAKKALAEGDGEGTSSAASGRHLPLQGKA